MSTNKAAISDEYYKKMTETPVLKLISTLSVPTILSMMISTIYNLADTAFVGTLGTSASGAVGVVFGFMSILQAIGFLFGQGGGSIMAQKLGSKDVQLAHTYASYAFFGSFFTSIIIAIICFILLDPLVMILGSTQTIAPYAKTYILFILMSAPFCASSFTLNNLLRYEGKAKLGMIGMMSGALLNIGGDALFIFGLNMGITGAGLSTAISQTLSFSILLSMFIRKKTVCTISIKKLHASPRIFFNTVTTGFPSLLRQALGSVTTMILNNTAAFYGDAAVAAMSIVGRIVFFIFSIAVGIGQGFQPVSSFNYGAKKYSRVRKGFKVTLILGLMTTIIFSVMTYINAPAVLKIFRDDPNVVSIGIRALRLQCLTVIFLPISMVTEMMYQSTGKKLGATILSTFRGGIFFVPSILLLSHFRGLEGIQESQPVSFVLSGLTAIIFAAIYFRKLPK